MKGFIEIKEDSYEDTMEYLHKIKVMACKLIKTLAKQSESYDRDMYEDEDYEIRERRNRGRYSY